MISARDYSSTVRGAKKKTSGEKIEKRGKKGGEGKGMENHQFLLLLFSLLFFLQQLGPFLWSLQSSLPVLLHIISPSFSEAVLLEKEISLN